VLELLVCTLFPTGLRVKLVDTAATPPSPGWSCPDHHWLMHLVRISREQTFEQRSRARMKIPQRRRKEIARAAAAARWEKASST
jgi:hypothetical protein